MGSVVAKQLALAPPAIIIVALSGLVITFSSTSSLLAVALKKAHADKRTLSDLLKESILVVDTILAGHFKNPSLNEAARLTLALEYLLLYARDHVAPTRDKVIKLLSYDPVNDRFTRLARCPQHSTGQSGTTALMRRDNCLAGQALRDGSVKYYGDVSSKAAAEGGFNNKLGRGLEGSLVVVPIFGEDDQPLGVLSCACPDRFAFAKGDVELLLLLSVKVLLAWTIFGHGVHSPKSSEPLPAESPMPPAPVAEPAAPE